MFQTKTLFHHGASCFLHFINRVSLCFVAQTERHRLRALAALQHQQRRFPQQAAKGRVAAERILKCRGRVKYGGVLPKKHPKTIGKPWENHRKMVSPLGSSKMDGL